MISPDKFLDTMRSKWSEYGNVGSPALDQVWLQICEVMNQQIGSPSLPRPVIPAELGAGKSTSVLEAPRISPLLTKAEPLAPKSSTPQPFAYLGATAGELVTR